MNRIPDIKRLREYFTHAEKVAKYFFDVLEECKDDELYIRQSFYTFKADYELLSFIEHEIEGTFYVEYGEAGIALRQRMDQLRMIKVRICSSYHEYRAWADKNLVPDFNDDLPF